MGRLKYTLMVLIISMISVHTLARQTTLSGKVTDKASGEGIPGVSVYLSGTTNGAQTDDEGVFTFRTSVKGQYSLVATLLGYTRQAVDVIVEEGKEIEKNFQLEVRQFELEEIEVRASNAEWAKKFNAFKSFFLGNGPYSGDMDLLNPEVLNFNEIDNGQIEVEAEQPLHLRNRSLGYDILVDIVEIRFLPDNNEGVYKTYSSFTELKPTASRTMDRWKENREMVYKGSSLHFFRSLIKDKVNREGFDLLPVGGDFEKIQDQSFLYPYFKDRYFKMAGLYEFFRLTEQPVIVGHRLRYNLSDEVTDEDELTYIYYATNRPFFMVSKNGLVYDPAYLSFKGKWGKERTSLYLPSDYSPE